MRIVEVFYLGKSDVEPAMVVERAGVLKAPPFEAIAIELRELFEW